MSNEASEDILGGMFDAILIGAGEGRASASLDNLRYTKIG